MKKEIVVMNLISRKLSNLIEELSTNEFIEEVGDEIYVQTGNSLSPDDVKDLVGSKVIPLLEKITEFSKENG